AAGQRPGSPLTTGTPAAMNPVHPARQSRPPGRRGRVRGPRPGSSIGVGSRCWAPGWDDAQSIRPLENDGRNLNGIDDTVTRLLGAGAELMGEVVRYGNYYRLCYLRGPAGIIVALAEEL